MLPDHWIEQERWAHRGRERRKLAWAFGGFIANLARWDWFLTLTFRDRTLRGEARASTELRRHGKVAICRPDARLVNYQLSSRYSPRSGPPVPAVALRGIEQWFMGLQAMARSPVGWVIAEEFGRTGGRWHCHALVTGVSRLHRKSCWQEARRRFGYARIVPFDPARGAPFYVAKYAGRPSGQIHFGGTLAGTDLSQWEVSPAEGGGCDVAVSVPLPKNCYHMTLPCRHR